MNSSEDFHRNENGWQNSVIIIPALFSGSTLIIVAIILWRSIRRKRENRQESEGKMKALYGDWAVNAAGVFENSLDVSDPVLEKRQLPAGWTLEHRVLVCDGHFGPISRVDLCRPGEANLHVVLKELSEHCSPGEVQDFIDLMKFYVQVCNHNSLVTMLWCQTERRPPSIIMKAMSHGNLLASLRSSQECAQASEGAAPRITEKDVYSMALQVASGLEYLSGTHDLVHGYVAACNLLLHEDLSVQLCGLGLAAIQYRSGSVPVRRAAQVPLKWQSPERLKGADITEKSDVWSFGILLYELVTMGSPPYPDLEPSQLPAKLKKNFKMERPTLCGPQLFEVMSNCWQWEAPLRPCFTDVMKLLQNGQDQADGWTPLTPRDMLSWREYVSVAGIPV
ncbi:tyrosine-protein kinase STYK1-like isoform X2 [Ranitomeya variabilis]|uniref:tyrosine-protein kinase STYK1-like isoform X2 n=1 Tax=Ranitomeya variabilis TaxID=490064 RepID=UPI00405649FF